MNVLMVAGGKGGVGKSSVAAGLARTLSKLTTVGLLDADLGGPSQPALFECTERIGAKNGAVVPARTAEGVRLVSSALLARAESPLVWSGAAATSAIETLAAPAVWHDSNWLIVDMPPGHSEVAVAVARAFSPDARGVLVTTGSHLATQECIRSAGFFHRMEIPILGVVENMATLACAYCANINNVFDATGVIEMCNQAKLDLLTRVPLGAAVAYGEGLGEVTAAAAAAFSTRRSVDQAERQSSNHVDMEGFGYAL
jgi:ATP-binding protein involved in chromosome partitioning